MNIINAFEFDAARRAYTRFTINAAARLARDVGFSYEPVDVAPSTYEEVSAEYQRCKRTHAAFRVWNGASDKTVFTSPEGNYAFRFWHDVVSHGADGRTFDLHDELLAGSKWVAKVAAEFGDDSVEARIAHADTIGQSLYADDHGGDFPVDQLAFVMEQLGVIDSQPTNSARTPLSAAGVNVY